MLTSARGTMRWNWLGICLAVAFGLLLLSIGISTVLDLSQGVPFETDFSATKMWTLLTSRPSLLVPFQAAAEEYVFRGYFMQLDWQLAAPSGVRNPAAHPVLRLRAHVRHLRAARCGAICTRRGMAGLADRRARGLHCAARRQQFGHLRLGLHRLGRRERHRREAQASLPFSAVTMAVFVLVVVKLANKRQIERLNTGSSSLTKIIGSFCQTELSC